MKAVILAGGKGTRISEESVLRPKPMIEIGSMPILWHIMKIYSAHGIKEFVICLGYKGHLIKEFFANYLVYRSNLTINLRQNRMQFHHTEAEDWTITLVDTGEETQTGGRIKRVASFLNEDEPFCLTYGDGVADIDIKKLLAFHHEQGLLATVTGVQPPGRFGALQLNGHRVSSFQEKPKGDNNFINGGFFVLNKKILNLIADDTTVFENEPLKSLATQGQLAAYKHEGFWQPMDTMRDKHQLEALWADNKAPWRVW